MIEETVCAVVVTYNRKDLLLECLEALQRQTRPIQAIYLIDNASTDNTPELLLDKGYIKDLPPQNLSTPWEKIFEVKNLVDKQAIKFHYVRMHENTGGAGGFHEGVKRAYEKGYDWLWLMDDDAEPREDALENLGRYFSLYKKGIVALASLKLGLDGKVLHPHRGYFNFKKIFNGIVKPFNEIDIKKREYIDIDHASFVGILINKKAVKQVGYPKSEFFIHYDDVEYCIRLRKIGQILLILNSIIVHKEAAKSGEIKTFMGRKSLRIPFNKYWLTYYGKRNLLWLGRRYSTNKFNFYLNIIRTLLKSILGIIIFDDRKLKRINFLINSYMDGLRGKFDNEKPKRILYDN